MKHYFLFKIRQFFRILAELGFLRVLIGFIFFLYVFFRIALQNNPIVVLGTASTIIFFLHIFRNDKKFFKIAHISSFQIYLFEYIILSIPFILLIVLFKQFHLLIGFLLIIPISFLDINLKISNTIFNFSFLNPTYFEWIVGFRKNALMLILLFLAKIFLSFYHVLVMPILSLFTLVLLMSFFMENEPHSYLYIFRKNAKQLLWYKIKVAFIIWSIFLILPFVVFIIFHFSDFWVMLVIWILGGAFLAFCQISKYAFYEPNIFNSKVQIFNLFALLGLGLPFFAPIPIFWTYRFYNRAITNLKFYLAI